MNVSFVIGKCRLVPLNEKTLSVLKLELQAAVTAVRIKNKLIENAKLNVNRILLWSDCKTVSKYIKNDNKHFPVFVTYRVTEIREHSNKSKWHYIPGTFNVADGCTRPTKFEKFRNNYRYLNGPKILRCLELPNFSCSDLNNIISSQNI